MVGRWFGEPSEQPRLPYTFELEFPGSEVGGPSCWQPFELRTDLHRGGDEWVASMGLLNKGSSTSHAAHRPLSFNLPCPRDLGLLYQDGLNLETAAGSGCGC